MSMLDKAWPGFTWDHVPETVAARAKMLKHVIEYKIEGAVEGTAKLAIMACWDAKAQEDAWLLVGSVPERDGVIVFAQMLDADPGDIEKQFYPAKADGEYEKADVKPAVSFKPPPFKVFRIENLRAAISPLAKLRPEIAGETREYLLYARVLQAIIEYENGENHG